MCKFKTLPTHKDGHMQNERSSRLNQRKVCCWSPQCWCTRNALSKCGHGVFENRQSFKRCTNCTIKRTRKLAPSPFQRRLLHLLVSGTPQAISVTRNTCKMPVWNPLWSTIWWKGYGKLCAMLKPLSQGAACRRMSLVRPPSSSLSFKPGILEWNDSSGSLGQNRSGDGRLSKTLFVIVWLGGWRCRLRLFWHWTMAICKMVLARPFGSRSIHQEKPRTSRGFSCLPIGA